MYSIEERLARAEVKLERMDKLEEELKQTRAATREALMELARVYNRNFDILSGRVSRSRKSDGFFADFLDW